jgi:histidinol-phosphate aminotransferase
VGAIEALRDEKFLKESIELNFKEMDRYITFARERGLKYIDSYTNFITLFMPNEIDSGWLSHSLLKRGIIIRDLQSYGMNAIRVTIGLEEQNSRFFKVFDEIVV